MKAIIKSFLRNKRIFLAIVWFGISFVGDRLMFDFERLNVVNYISIKILLLVILMMFFWFLPRLTFLKTRYFWAFVVVFGIVFALLYPGTWLGSDLALIYDKAITCDFFYHLNYLTTLFYIISFMLVPLPVAPIIFEMLLAVAAFAYVADKTRGAFGLKKCYGWVIMMPLLLTHTIFYVLYPNRPILLGLMVLVLLATLFCDGYTKRKTCSKLKLATIILLTAIASNIRSESVYLIVAVPVLFFATGYIKVTGKSMLKYGAAFFLAFLALAAPQKIYEIGQTAYERQSRNLPSYISPLSLMLNGEIGITDEEIIAIDRVLDVKSMKEHASKYDVPCMWNEDNCVRTFDSGEYDEFKKAALSVVWRNKKSFLNAKFQVFEASMALKEADPFTTYELFDDGGKYELANVDIGPLVDSGVRRKLYAIIEGRSENSLIDSLNRVVGNLLVPILAVVVGGVYLAVKKRWAQAWISAMVVLSAAVVFLTAPAAYFMYYFYVYLWGWYLISLAIIRVIMWMGSWRLGQSGKRRAEI